MKLEELPSKRLDMLNDLSLILKVIQHVNTHTGLYCKVIRIQCLVCALFLIKSLV